MLIVSPSFPLVGSGWGWLVAEGGKLSLLSTTGADTSGDRAPGEPRHHGAGESRVAQVGARRGDRLRRRRLAPALVETRPAHLGGEQPAGEQATDPVGADRAAAPPERVVGGQTASVLGVERVLIGPQRLVGPRVRVGDDLLGENRPRHQTRPDPAAVGREHLARGVTDEGDPAGAEPGERPPQRDEPVTAVDRIADPRVLGPGPVQDRAAAPP